jgi:PAS domain S-box-containing protein
LVELTTTETAGATRANVLIVDDTPANLLALRAVLEPLRQNVVEARTGEAALKYLIANDCAVILLDARLPGMSGFEVAEALRSRPRTRDIPILFVTGTLQDSASTGYAQGAFDYIVKPFDPDVMRAKVGAIVRLYLLRRRAEVQRDALQARELAAQARSLSHRESVELLAGNLRASEARLRGLAEAMPQQLFVASVEGDLEFVNGRLAAYAGRTVEQALAEGWLPPVHPDEHAACRAAWDLALARGTPFEAEVRLRQASDGEYRWHLARALPERGAAGELLRWHGTLTDIHAHKLAMADLAQANAFQQQLLAEVGHDLSNPLNAISVTSQLLQKQAGPSLEPLVARIARSTLRMKRMIGDIVDFTRARISGGLPLSRQPCAARDLCREVIDELSLVHPDRPVRLEPGDAGDGEWDALRLQQAVSNLVGNGLQYSPPGTDVVVRVESLPDTVTISVHNQGPAIPASALARVFEPFKRREEAHPQGSNLGLGLYIVAEVVRAHGGTVEVQSDEAAGTCFTLRLPRR